MRDTKMLQAIIDGQKALEERLSEKIDKVHKELISVEGNLARKIDKNGRRLDKLGRQLAYLEDDAPTVEEFDKLEKRVSKIEKQLARN